MNTKVTTEWYELEARSSAKDLWAIPKWEGQSELGPWLLPDGRDIIELIATGDVDELGFPIWFEPYQSYRQAGDLIWTTSWMKLASERFVEVLRSVGATGFQTYETNLRTKRGEAIPGFVGLGVNSSSDDTDLSNPYPAPSFSFRARPHVVDALKSAGVTELKIRPWREE